MASFSCSSNLKEELYCFCGRKARLRTSSTAANPGRRFFNCRDITSGCDFFVWEDEALGGKPTALISALREELEIAKEELNKEREELKKVRVENARLRERVKMLLCVLIISWLHLFVM